MSTTPATDWAWSQIESPNIVFTADEALTLLGFARFADDALNSPSGYRETSVEAVARRTGGFWWDVTDQAKHLAEAGLLVRVHTPISTCFRVSEDAFRVVV